MVVTVLTSADLLLRSGRGCGKWVSHPGGPGLYESGRGKGEGGIGMSSQKQHDSIRRTVHHSSIPPYISDCQSSSSSPSFLP